MSTDPLSNLLSEERSFPPPPGFAATANVTAGAYRAADEDRLGFWAEQARRLSWAEAPSEVLDWSRAPFARWFADGRINAAYNCVDRHVEAGLGNRVAIHFEGEPGDTRTLTYADLLREVSRAANALTSLGITAGDRVALYLPMIPETLIAMLACARIGAIHSVVFGGFSADAVANRIQDADAKLLITADGSYRRGKPTPLKPAVDRALESCPGVRNVLVVRRTGEEVPLTPGRDLWWHDLVPAQSDRHTPEAFDAQHPLFIMYTSGTTGKPKGIVHTTGGYLIQAAYTHHAVFDLKPETDVYWCTADVRWVTGHSYIVYGPLAGGATQVIYEGTPDTPHTGRWWEIVEKYGVTLLYTAPTAIRTCMKWGDDIPARYDLTSLRLLGSVGEPINPEAWMWYREKIGGGRCPIVDTWWQTETGAMMIAPLPGVTATKPGSAMTPLPGIRAEVVDDEGRPVPEGSGGYLVLTEPWPSMPRSIWRDDDRYVDTYWSRFSRTTVSSSGEEITSPLYFAGDGAKKDTDGHIWLLGRVDDVMLVSGHNISTTEVESALVSHPSVAEAAVVGVTDPQTTQAIVAFVILRDSGGTEADGEAVIDELRAHVAATLGPIAKPRRIVIVPELPKTRSGKITRRLLRDLAEDRRPGDTTTLADPSVMELIARQLTTTPAAS
ncbi:acetate--CoA ligase [Streptomyces ipomoeae]|uniref:acetate--CoA ligase n=1 Tax=Streptomyces ipomoeae TaxID=103232 RepID=UPI0011477914|nr:acetate--CoA ligase [Streptomyces ipomoeae]TQE23585.1 acetate--CoA ligase [Streptomyces ipomoeae]